jgi:hypothetical protein
MVIKFANWQIKLYEAPRLHSSEKRRRVIGWLVPDSLKHRGGLIFKGRHVQSVDTSTLEDETSDT